MSESPQNADGVTVLLEEYRELSADIRMRVALQHRNMNVLVVLIAAVSSLLVAHHLIQPGISPDQLTKGQLSLIIALVPILISFFVWRNLDHDVAIIRKGQYIYTYLRPKLEDVVKIGVMDFERQLQQERETALLFRWLSNLGQEGTLMVSMAAGYVGVGWYQLPLHTDIQPYYLAAIVVSSALLVAMGLMMLTVGRQYRGMTADSGAEQAQLGTSQANPDITSTKNRYEVPASESLSTKTGS